MATLTETAQFARKFVKFSVISIISLVLIRGIWQLAAAWYKQRHPAPPPPPTVAFGKLPRVNFPETQQPELTFKLQTASGETPDLSDRATIYFMPYLKANLLALDRANQQVAKLGFKDEPVMVDVKNYRWIKNETKTWLEMNIITGETEMEYDWRNDQQVLSTKNPPGREQAVAEAKRFLQQAEMITEDLQLGETKVSYWQYDGKTLTESLAPSEANFARVDFFRQSQADLPVVTSSGANGIVSLMLSSLEDNNRRVIKLSYHYFPVDYQNSATYPIKVSSLAYRDLQTRQGFIAEQGNNSSIAVIRKIYLAYFDSAKPQQYLQPVYVFEGDNGFIAYVSAIDDQWLE